MKNDYRVIDLDGHVLDTAPDVLKVLEANLPREYRSRAPTHIPIPTGGGRTLLEGHVWSTPRFPPREGQDSYGWMVGKRGMYDPQIRLRDMDGEGIDSALLFGGALGLGAPGLKDKGLCRALIGAYNSWLAQYCSADPRRLKGVAALPMRDPEAAPRELRRAVRELGFVGACVPSNLDGYPPDHENFMPVYREAEELGVPVFIHATSAAPGIPSLVWGHTSPHTLDALAQPIEMMVALPAITMTGVIDKFPTVRFVFLEGNASWLPYWMHRLEEYWTLNKATIPARRRPRDYLAEGRLMFSCSHDEADLPHAIETLGDEWLAYNSDYWHSDAKFPGAVDELLSRRDLSDSSKRKILSGNAERLLGKLVAV